MDPLSSARSSTNLGFEAREKTSERKTKRRITPAANDKPPPSRWRNPSEQRIYSSNLLRAIRRVRQYSSCASSSSGTAPRSRAVREAADRVLATAARGRTRWSRAILLAHRRTLKIKSAKRKPRKPATRTSRKKSGCVVGGGGVALERKAKVLGRLVPGCGKLSLPTLLEETTDYIAALEMQVRAMSALAEILSSVGDRNPASSAAASTTGGDASPSSLLWLG